MRFSFGTAAIYSAVMVLAMRQAEAAPGRVLRNHVPAAVKESQRLGPISRDARLNLAVGLPLRNAEELDRLLSEVSDPASPNYQHYLSSSEFVERFGPAQRDYNKLIAYFEGNGFTVSGTHPNRLILDVSGPVWAVEKTLHVNLAMWLHPKRGQFMAPSGDPSLDVDVEVADVAGLDNFALPRPMDMRAARLTSATPLASTGSGPSGTLLGADFRAAYAPAVTLTGSGQSIGLLEFDGFFPGDVTANFKQAGLPVVPVSTVLVDGSTGAAGGDNIEVILDIMMAAYMAPGANIIVYEGYYPNDVLNKMATDNAAKQLSSSWGFGSANTTTDNIFKQFVAQGQSLMQASGDSGAWKNGVMYPSDNPNLTVVGGTALTTSGPAGAWVSETAWSGSGGGVSTVYPIPSYQQAMNMTALGGSNTMRNVPDVALTASQQIFLICNNGQWIMVGGTSAAAPLWAGFLALANQQAASTGKSPVGFLNPLIYSLGGGAGFAAELHDITTGSNGFAAHAGFDLATGWGTPVGQPLIDALTSVTAAPSFTLSSTPAAATLQPGSSAAVTVQVANQNGFSGSVSLSASGLPSGVTASFGAVSASGASTLTLTASSGAAAGNSTIGIRGVSGTLTANVNVALTVTGAASFSLQAAAPSVSVTPGGNSQDSISVAAANGFTGNVTLSVSGLPTGVTASFSPAATSASSTLTFTAASTAAVGTTTVTVTGTSGSLRASVSLSLTVKANSGLSLTATPASVSMAPGASATSVIAAAASGLTGTLAFSVTGLPAGVSAAFSSPTANGGSTLTFKAASTAAATTVAVTVKATLATASATTTISLTVKGAPGFSLAATPASLSVTQGTSAASAIAVTPVNGFSGAVALSVSGLPSGVTASLGVSAGSATAALTLTASASAPAGAATVTVSGTSGAITAKTTVALAVAAAPAGFKLTSSSTAVNLAPGAKGSTTISISRQGSFTSAVALTATGMPSGVTASFSPASATSSSILTLTAASGTPSGAGQVTIKGTAGSLSASLSIPIVVAAPPDFSVALAPSSLTVAQGSKAATAISLSALNGFSGVVTISATGLPAGVSAAFAPLTNGGVILGTFTAFSSAAPATTNVSLTATSGSLSHVAFLSLAVVAPGTGTAVTNLAPVYNVSGSAADYVPFSSGGLDGLGRSYSGVLLGGSLTWGGTVFALGPMGVPDAVSSQTVTLPAGSYTALKFLAAGVNGNQPGQTFTVTYSDGTKMSFTQGISDWYTPQGYPGEAMAQAMLYRDNSTGTRDGRPFYLYGYSVPLNNAKTVRSLTLPNNRNVVVMAITLTGVNSSAAH